MGASSDPIEVREVSTVKFAMDVAGTKKALQARQGAITDGSDAGSTQAAVNAVIVVLENLGFITPN